MSGMKGLFCLLLLYLIKLTIATPNCEGSSTDVQLCSSSPRNVLFVCPGESLTFTCMTFGSPFLTWISDQYVGDSGSHLFFSALQDIVGTTKQSPNNISIANLTMLNNPSNLDMIILESQLHFNVSDQYNSSEIKCLNSASGMNATINFNVDLSAECGTMTTTDAGAPPITMELSMIIILPIIAAAIKI